MIYSIINFFATTKHKLWVAWYMLRACWTLVKRAWVHDLSKYSKEEAPYFAANLKALRATTYGTPAYGAALKKLRPALSHHYGANSHHPEHYAGECNDMSPLDLIEMICDWKAATRRHKDGSLANSFKVNEKRFKGLPRRRLERDAREIGLL